MFDILNATIFAVYTLFTKLVRVLPTLNCSRNRSQFSREHVSVVEFLAQQEQKNEVVRRLLSCLGIELQTRVPVKVRSDASRFKRR